MSEDKDINGIVYSAKSPSGKYYIGITIYPLKKRMRQHEIRSEKRKTNLPAFHSAIKKYGFDNFEWEIIEDNITSWEKLCELEIYYIIKYDSYNNGYNLTKGGEGSFGRKHSEETKEKIRKSINEYNRGEREPYSQKPKRSQSEVNREINIKRFKKQEERDKMSRIVKKRYEDPKERERNSIAQGGKPFLVYKIIDENNHEFIGEWINQSECGRILGVAGQHISECLRGNRRTAKGYIFIVK